MYSGMYASRRPPSLEEQCLAHLKFFETHVSLRNVELLSQVADELKLDDLPLRELTGRHLPSISTLFKNQLRIAPTLAGDDFIHIVGTVAAGSSRKNTHLHSTRSSSQERFDCDGSHRGQESRCSIQVSHQQRRRRLSFHRAFSGQRRINLFPLAG